jgi:hypothetical protein
MYANFYFYFYFRLLYTSHCWSRRIETYAMLRVQKYIVMLDRDLLNIYLLEAQWKDVRQVQWFIGGTQATRWSATDS